MHGIKTKFQIICLMAFLLGLHVPQVPASSSGDRVLSDVSIDMTGQQIVIRVAFNYPVRYLRHYPLDTGKELHIQLDPIMTGPDALSMLQQRESLSAPPGNPAGLVRIDYEGSDGLKPTMRVILDTTRSYTVREGDDFRSLEILLPDTAGGGNDAGAVEAGPRVGGRQQTPAGTMSRQRQDSLLGRGEKAVAAQEYMQAILIYTELLDADDPKVRELAQFRLATAQEQMGHLAHARAEYKNYLNAYPDGENAEEARARLKVLMSGLDATGDITGAAPGLEAAQYFGSVSVYYDRDESLYDDGPDMENLSSLTTGFDATWRSRGEKFAAEAVVIGSYELSFLDRRNDLTRINRAYFDFDAADGIFTGRLGRQSSSKGGVLTRFDGAQLGYRFMDKVRVNLVGGFPVNLPYDDLETDRYLYGINFDLGRFADHWDVNTYIINQLADDDIEDRRAVGLEARYIGRRGSLYSLLDYDILYDDPSVFLVTGNYQLPNDATRLNVMIDFRGVPLLSTTNALIGQASPSLEELEASLGEDEVRRLAEDRTLDSSFVNLGLSQTLTQNLQVAGDISWSKIDGAPASGGVDAFDSTGDEFFYSLQLIGSSLIKPGDIATIGLRYGDTQYRDIYTLTANTRFPLTAGLQLNPRIQVEYRENTIRPGDQWRFLPGLRIEYRLSKNWLLELDGEYRYADKELEGIADGKDGYMISAGIRLEF